ncbi:hypothetical protein [Reichenbachiella ulvae]|uniref:Uncharacterized protein n=1 Tax=Reichenbachiella ulvae TaxID=2980104 RepID=A0ABT3CTL7_9BACT|nr:hypothetical protein [Reichenbachiella ulvae]MCV9386820.1 hypothetical protein [Reichenbachiella ulvae]
MYNSKKKAFMMLGGILLLAGSQIINHYTHQQSFVQGVMLGCGVGMMISGLIKKRKTSEQ